MKCLRFHSSNCDCFSQSRLRSWRIERKRNGCDCGYCWIHCCTLFRYPWDQYVPHRWGFRSRWDRCCQKSLRGLSQTCRKKAAEMRVYSSSLWSSRNLCLRASCRRWIERGLHFFRRTPRRGLRSQSWACTIWGSLVTRRSLKGQEFFCSAPSQRSNSCSLDSMIAEPWDRGFRWAAATQAKWRSSLSS